MEHCVVRLEGAPANQICYFREMGVRQAHFSWVNIDPQLRDGKKPGLYGDYVDDDVTDDV